ncbi:MAG TPA: hypothetical protein VIF12_04195, partial [Micavibrio sp.]
ATSAKADPTVMCAVKANYQGAVDVHGKPVASADVKSSAPVMPKSVRIPLTIDLAQRMNEILPTGMKLEQQVGTIEVRDDGHVIINGKDMTGPANTLCNTVARQKAAALKTKDAPKRKKIKRAAASVPANINEPAVSSQPVEPVIAEPTVAQPTAPVAPEAPVVPAPETTPDPEVLSTPAEQPPMQPPVQPPAPAMAQPVPDGTAQPPSNDTLSPSEGGMLPRPPSEDPAMVAPPANDALPTPPQNGNGTLTGGAQ